ncbi:hypothetical protein V6N12_072332 [Hibiscus sabdariffa]|uniref:BURP domain-containing protein n=1 Tax=Hibiscus sabdariffa TaxID=183260 RepID=A0ABR2FME7_9ROSI
MEFRFLRIVAMMLAVAIAATHSAVPVEMHWMSVFPNTPMPEALRNLLPSPAAAAAAAGNHMKAAVADMINENKGFITSYGKSKLHPGSKMNLKGLTGKASKTTFLPRLVADSIPFSTQKSCTIFHYNLNQPHPKYSNKQWRIVKHQPILRYFVGVFRGFGCFYVGRKHPALVD